MHKAIQIIEKPEWVSWDEIRKVLWESHAENREKGIKNALPSLPSDEIRKKSRRQGKNVCSSGWEESCWDLCCSN